jgi:hypothetical protein
LGAADLEKKMSNLERQNKELLRAASGEAANDSDEKKAEEAQNVRAN